MKIGTSRVETFSDSVISIIITIMVLTIKIPDVTRHGSAWTIRHNMQNLLPYVITYAFSFMMIGVFWINHHHMFHLLEKTDEPLLIQNLFFLFWMSLIPLGTAMVSANPQIPESAAVYGSVLLLTTITFAIMRVYTLRKNLVHRDKDKDVTDTIRWVSLKAKTKSLIGSLAYLCAIPLAFVNVYLAYIVFLIPPIIFFIPDGIDDESLAQKIEDKNSSP
ncbi:MAG TPA: TMEM175 family protein [Flavisolibacter sp.]|jgi:uncharacterized membrane protein|nr:TMEM175 family protein [Flavisolibacter sp.]